MKLQSEKKKTKKKKKNRMSISLQRTTLRRQVRSGVMMRISRPSITTPRRWAREMLSTSPLGMPSSSTAEYVVMTPSSSVRKSAGSSTPARLARRLGLAASLSRVRMVGLRRSAACWSVSAAPSSPESAWRSSSPSLFFFAVASLGGLRPSAVDEPVWDPLQLQRG